LFWRKKRKIRGDSRSIVVVDLPLLSELSELSEWMSWMMVVKMASE